MCFVEYHSFMNGKSIIDTEYLYQKSCFLQKSRKAKEIKSLLQDNMAPQVLHYLFIYQGFGRPVKVLVRTGIQSVC